MSNQINYLFLDIGGVLVPPDRVNKDLSSRWGLTDAFDSEAIQILREYLGENDEVEVVVISALRSFDGVIAAINKALDMRAERISTGPKGEQISEYIRKATRRGWTGRYVVLDDEPVAGHEARQVLVKSGCVSPEDVQKMHQLYQLWEVL